jgi:hypothetical protein
MAQSIEVEGQRIGCDPDCGRDFAGCHAAWSDLHQKPIDLKPMFLCERRQCSDRIYLIYISTNIEMTDRCQPIAQLLLTGWILQI